MNRNKNEASKNKGFYIAVCCCVLVIAIVGYVSWFAGNSKPETQNHTDLSYKDNSDASVISEPAKLPVKKETNSSERKTVPAETKNTPVAKNVIAEDNTPEFSKPVDGKVIAEFSGEKLVFNEMLSDWRSHDGVDFKAAEGDDVAACADGVIESVTSGSLGNCIVIDHENGLKSLYANLAETENGDITGQNVKKGDKIGKIGSSALADFSKEGHLHFEVLKDGNPVDPMEYFK